MKASIVAVKKARRRRPRPGLLLLGGWARICGRLGTGSVREDRMREEGGGTAVPGLRGELAVAGAGHPGVPLWDARPHPRPPQVRLDLASRHRRAHGILLATLAAAPSYAAELVATTSSDSIGGAASSESAMGSEGIRVAGPWGIF
jgi:hypothetical protein